MKYRRFLILGSILCYTDIFGLIDTNVTFRLVDVFKIYDVFIILIIFYLVKKWILKDSNLLNILRLPTS